MSPIDDEPVRRSSGRRAWLVLLLALAAVALLLWLFVPLVRARAYLWIGDPWRAYTAALRASDSAARDGIFAEILAVRAGSGTFWNEISGDADRARDPREPRWVAFGVHGQLVVEFIAEVETWPLLACSPRDADAPAEDPPIAAARFVGRGQGDAGQQRAEHAGYEAAHDRAINCLNAATGGEIDERMMAVVRGVAHVVGGAAGEIAANGRMPPSTLRELCIALRQGHVPALDPDDLSACAFCGGSAEPATDPPSWMPAGYTVPAGRSTTERR